MNAISHKISASRKILYGIGRFADGIKISAFNVFLFFFYSQVLGLSASLCGIAVFIALCIDAVSDPFIGHLSDNYRSRYGRRHPFMLASVLPLSVCFYLVFNPPENLSQLQLFFWLLVFVVVVRVSVSLFTIPHSALGAELSQDYHERSAVYGASTFFGYFGGVGSAAIGYAFYFVSTPEQPNGLLNANAYSGYSTWGATAMFLCILLCCWGTWPRREDQLANATIKDKPSALLSDLKLALMNRSFRFLFLGAIVAMMVVGAREALALYMGIYFWGLSTEEIFLLMVSYLCGVFFAAVLAKKVHRYVDKKWTLINCTVASLVCSGAGASLRLLGWFPENGSSLLLPILLFGSFVATLFGVICVITIYSMIADIADQHEFENHSRNEGIFFSAFSLAGKAASGFGLLLAGFAIDWIGFPESAAPGSVSAEVLATLGLFEGPLLCLIGLTACGLYLKYRLDHDTHAEIVRSLKLRYAQ